MTESKMVKTFKEKYGSETVICVGDWSKHNHPKFHEPVKGIGLRRIFRKAGYQVFLVDEYRTSVRCSYCGENNGICETFKKVKNPRFWRRVMQPEVVCHGLLKCTTCMRLWNRDVNASSNIWKIAASAIAGNDRPNYLKRNNN